MIVVVEIASRTGTCACKEYDAPSCNAAIEAVKRELRAYPTFRVTDIWVKGDRAVQPRISGRVVNSARRETSGPCRCYAHSPSHDAERAGAAMNFLDDLRAEWIAIRKSLGDHIAYLEAGNKIHPIDQDPNEATAEFLERLWQYRSEVEGWLVHLPSQGE